MRLIDEAVEGHRHVQAGEPRRGAGQETDREGQPVGAREGVDARASDARDVERQIDRTSRRQALFTGGIEGDERAEIRKRHVERDERAIDAHERRVPFRQVHIGRASLHGLREQRGEPAASSGLAA